MTTIDRDRWTPEQCRRWHGDLMYRTGDRPGDFLHPDRDQIIAESIALLSWGQLASLYAHVRDVVPLRTASDIHYALRSANNERPDRCQS